MTSDIKEPTDEELTTTIKVLRGVAYQIMDDHRAWPWWKRTFLQPEVDPRQLLRMAEVMEQFLFEDEKKE